MQTGDIRLVRKVNEKFILNLIRTRKIISGAELSVITKLRPSTVLSILNDLSSHNLILKHGKGESTNKGGKKPTLWKINSDSFYVIGLDLEVNEIKIVLLDLDGKVKSKRTSVITENRTLAGVTEQIVNEFDQILKINDVPKSKILGMGVAYAGVVNSDKGLIIKGDVIPEMNAPLLNELRNYFNFKIIIENNANAAAIGEKWSGQGIDKKHFMTILPEFDTNVGGIGIGIIINNELYHGSTFCAGELNQHLPKMIDILENFRYRFSESEFFNQYLGNINQINIGMVIEAAKKDDKIAVSMIMHFSNYLGKLIAKPVALLNPDALIISGPLSQLDNIIIDPLKDSINMEILSITKDSLQIICSDLGEYSVCIGAASLILFDFFKSTPQRDKAPQPAHY